MLCAFGVPFNRVVKVMRYNEYKTNTPPANSKTPSDRLWLILTLTEGLSLSATMAHHEMTHHGNGRTQQWLNVKAFISDPVWKAM